MCFVAEPGKATQVKGNGTKVQIYDRQTHALRLGPPGPEVRGATRGRWTPKTKLATEIASKLAAVK